MTDRLDSTTLSQRLTLLGVARLSADGDTPAHAGEIARICARQHEAIDGDVVGNVSEAEVTRALNELDADGIVETADAGERSPVGKGRPAYELRVDRTTLVEAFADDDRLDALLERLD
jgi:predicted ArsR family transcriptional regulator